MEPDVDDLLAAGVPDRRLTSLADRYADLVAAEGVEQRFRGAVPRVREMAEELASYGVAETLQHDDLHDGQVFVRDAVPLALRLGWVCRAVNATAVEDPESTGNRLRMFLDGRV